MTKDLPKKVPSAVLSAAEGALEETEDRIQRRQEAHAAYRSEAYRRSVETRRAHVMYDQLPAKAQALLDWGAMVQDQLPLTRLSNRFRMPGDAYAPCLPVANAEIALTARDGFPGGMLKTELLLILDPKEGVFRHEDRLDGFLVNGVGVLKTPSAILHSIDPDILGRLHDYVATESHVWWYVERGFGRLVRAYKDKQ